MYVFTCGSVYVYMSVCAYASRMCARVYVLYSRLSVWMVRCVYASLNVYVQAHQHVYIHICRYVHPCLYLCIYIYIENIHAGAFTFAPHLSAKLLGHHLSEMRISHDQSTLERNSQPGTAISQHQQMLGFLPSQQPGCRTMQKC